MTTTVPEAEEHIAVDPSSFKNLIGMISAFAWRVSRDKTHFSRYMPERGTHPYIYPV
jgi:hypothetical protein